MMKKQLEQCQPTNAFVRCRNALVLFLLSALFLATGNAAFAVTKTSLPGGTGGVRNWNAATTWSPSGVPQNGDDVIIAAGTTVRLNYSGATPILNSLTVNGTLNREAKALTAGSLSGASTGNIINNGSPLLTVGSNGANTTYAGVFTTTTSPTNGIYHLWKVGSGTLTLTGTNTSGGVTGIENGTVKLGAANALPGNELIVYNGGTLDLNGFDEDVPNMIDGTTTNNPATPRAILTNSSSTAATLSFGGVGTFGSSAGYFYSTISGNLNVVLLEDMTLAGDLGANISVSSGATLYLGYTGVPTVVGGALSVASGGIIYLDDNASCDQLTLDGVLQVAGTHGHTISTATYTNDTYFGESDFVLTAATGASAGTTWYVDADGDGFGNPLVSQVAATQPAGYVADNTDCNDNDNLINPGSTEICNSIDDNCVGGIDEGLSLDWYVDADGDGFGTGATPALMQCADPGAGYASANGDCDDADDNIFPGATEVCNGKDDDCDGTTDEGFTPSSWYVDADGDGYGAGAALVQCNDPGAGYVSNAGDCDDSNAAINSAAPEICDGIDNDCDGFVDDADAGVTGQGEYYTDLDGDGFGAGAAILACVQPANTAIVDGDCNDTNSAINPDAQEVCDGIDNDCDGLTDTGDPDADTQAPVITCPANTTISCDASQLPVNTGSATATDNSGSANVTYSDAANQLLPSTFPGGTAIQGRVRWGGTGYEGGLFIGGTVGPQLNPAGTPVWVYGTSYKFEYGYNGTTGDQTMSIDFNGDNSFGAGEVITQSSAFAGQGFKHFSIFMSGSATRTITLSNFVVNGVSLGTFVSPATGNIDKAWENNAGLFSNITATGSITFTGTAVGGDETGRVWFRTATPVSIPAAPACPQNYVINRVWTATDACGNSSQCVQNITVQDVTAPVISNAAGSLDQTVSCAADVPAADNSLINATDNCGTPVITSADVTTPGSNVNNFIVTRTYTATDACGNASTFVQVITVNDATAPVITTCPAPITISCEASTDPSNTGSALATDNCGTANVTYSDAADQLLPSTFPGGTAIQGRVRWGGTGYEGGLFIGGTVGPQLNPAGTPVWAIGTAYKFEYDYNGTTGAQTMSIDFNGDNSFGAGEVITQATAFAGQGFKHFSIFMSGDATRGITLNNFVVNGVSLGTFVSPATGNIDKAWENNAGLFSNITATGTITFTGATGGSQETGRIWFRTATPVSIPAAPACPQNYVINRVWTATDASGNISQCVQNITVQDVTAPVISNAAGSLDQTVSCAADVPAADNSLINATDNCATPVITSNDVIIAGSCANNFTVTRTYTATDACGNASTFVQVITVNDQTAPVISNTAGSLDASVTCAADVPAANNSLINVTDNCAGVVSITSNDVTTPGTCANNFTVTRTYTATDVCGNASTFVQVITVNDNIAPVISGSIAASNVAGCSASAAPAAVTTVAALEALGLTIADNCTADGALTVTSSDASAGSCPIVVTRTYTVSDACGNASTYAQTINVNDQVAPVTPTLADQTVLLCSATPVAPTTTDDCSGTVTGTTTTVFPLTTVGTTVVTWTFTDACGNSTTANQNVIVLGAPATGAISGPSSQCIPVAAGSASYSVASVPFVTNYNWTVPAGMSIASGQGTSSITVNWTTGAASAGIIGAVSVTPSNACGAGSATTLNIGLTPVVPVTPGSISGNSRVCPGDVVTYSVAAVARATSYNWTLPAGMTLLSGSGTNIISVSVNGAYIGGTISVSAGNACGNGPSRTKALGLNLPLTPAPISGPSSGVCAATSVVYSTSGAANATSYLWTVPAGATIVSGQGTTSITVNFSGMTANTANVTVTGSNACGNGLTRSFSITRLPGRPVFSLVPAIVCVGVDNTYQVNTVAGADSYNWIVPTGSNLVSGQTTKTAVVNFTAAAISNPNRIINVSATNTCGTGPIASTPSITVNSCTPPRMAGNNGISEVNLFPNPTSDRSLLIFNSETEGDYLLSVIDLSGRVLFEENRAAVIGVNQAEINLGGFAQGIYLVRVRNANNDISLRLMVE